MVEFYQPFPTVERRMRLETMCEIKDESRYHKLKGF